MSKETEEAVEEVLGGDFDDSDSDLDTDDEEEEGFDASARAWHQEQKHTAGHNELHSHSLFTAPLFKHEERPNHGLDCKCCKWER